MSKSVAISGYRASKMALCRPAEGLQERIEQAVGELCDEGFDTFYCGMADGFDIMAARAVLNVRDQRGDVRLIAVVPFAGHGKTLADEQKVLYEHIISQCDAHIVVADKASKLAFLRRNDYMVERSEALLCYYNGIAGGTRYTLRRAAKSGLRIVNICREGELNGLF